VYFKKIILAIGYLPTNSERLNVPPWWYKFLDQISIIPFNMFAQEAVVGFTIDRCINTSLVDISDVLLWMLSCLFLFPVIVRQLQS